VSDSVVDDGDAVGKVGRYSERSGRSNRSVVGPVVGDSMMPVQWSVDRVVGRWSVGRSVDGRSVGPVGRSVVGRSVEPVVVKSVGRVSPVVRWSVVGKLRPVEQFGPVNPVTVKWSGPVRSVGGRSRKWSGQ
jgi:hypothetical protein